MVVFTWSEMLRFIKKRLVIILIGTFFLSTLFVIAMYLLFPPQNSNAILFSSDSTVEKKYAKSSPASFRFYIEDDNSEPYTNNKLLEQYIVSDEKIQQLESKTKINLLTKIKENNNSNNLVNQASANSKIIEIGINENSKLMEFKVNTGSERENLLVADYFYNELNYSNVPLLKSKDIFIITTPELNEIRKVKNPEIRDNSEIYNYISKNFTIGISLAFPITIFVMLIINQHSKILDTSLSYHIKETDVFLLIDKKSEREDREFLFKTLKAQQKNVVISEQTNTDESSRINKFLETLYSNQEINKINSISENQKTNQVEKIIYIIEQGKTSRDWYKKQRRLDDLYNIPTLVVHLSDDI